MYCSIYILQDSDSEGPETFFVNMTGVELSTGSPIGGAAPSVKHGQDVAEITIGQNDFANGILQLNATKVCYKIFVVCYLYTAGSVSFECDSREER